MYNSDWIALKARAGENINLAEGQRLGRRHKKYSNLVQEKQRRFTVVIIGRSAFEVVPLALPPEQIGLTIQCSESTLSVYYIVTF